MNGAGEGSAAVPSASPESGVRNAAREEQGDISDASLPSPMFDDDRDEDYSPVKEVEE